jgi:hypothetical protein
MSSPEYLPEAARKRLQAQTRSGSSVTPASTTVGRPSFDLQPFPRGNAARVKQAWASCLSGTEAVLRLTYIREARTRPDRAEQAPTRPAGDRLVRASWALPGGNKPGSAVPDQAPRRRPDKRSVRRSHGRRTQQPGSKPLPQVT